ncbi:MAG: DUF427 domain-containing protein [Bacteroidota bacterium]
MDVSKKEVVSIVNKIKPKPGQESVWDYPRPPAIEKVSKHIRVVFNEEPILDTNQSFRILETSHPPTYYLPKFSFKEGVLLRTKKASFCEFKGMAHYYDLVFNGKEVKSGAWGYDQPTSPYEALKDHVCLYAQFMDACYINDERVIPQPGGFYGGWITNDIVGPFKGESGTWGW